MQTNEELRLYFPDMEPIEKPPGLFTLNGIGTSMYGKRDLHDETGAYIKTRCICFVFVPLIALGSYRVLDAPGGGWYFLGREPLSHFAKRWNALSLLALVMIAGFGTYFNIVNSGSYRARQLIQQAKGAHQKGQLNAAITKYERAAAISRSHRREAVGAIDRMIREDLPKASPAQLRPIVQRFRHKLPSQLKRRYPALFSTGAKLAKKHAAQHPKLSLSLYELLLPIAPSPKAFKGLLAAQATLLEKSVKKYPKDATLATKLALVYERTERCKRCFGLLRPHEKHFLKRNGEGARLLGEQYARKRQFAKAHKLLEPYVQARLKQLHKVEAAYKQTSKQVRSGALVDLRRRRGPREFYRKSFRKLPKKERTRRVIMYIQQRLRNSPRLAYQRQALRKASRIVPVAMSLGIVKLQRARSLRHPAQRRKELRSAERILLAIRGVAGRSDQYKLYLGQVYYWLGKQEKGKRLFAQLLKKRQRDSLLLLRLSRILREVGSRVEARQMAEEAYYKTKKKDHKHQAASMRALTAPNIEDKILWLKRAEGGNPAISALLNTTLGDRAMQRGLRDKAAAYYRKAIKAYDAMDKHPANLNNSALAYFSLFQAAGDRKAFQKGIQQIQEAIAMRPSDSILLFNAADAMLRASLLDVIGGAFSPSQLMLQVQLGLLTHLYRDERQRSALLARFAAKETLKKARSLYSKVLLLAPNNAYAYQSMASLYSYLRDPAGMKETWLQCNKARFSVTDSNAQTRDIYTGRRDIGFRIAFRKELARRQQLLKQLQKRRKRRAASIVSARIANTKIALAMFGGATGDAFADRIVDLAQKAFGTGPSSYSRKSLISALMYRALYQLSKKHPAMRQLWEHSRRALTPKYIVAGAMHDQSKLRELLLKHPDIKRAVALIAAHVKALPARPSPLYWGLLRYGAPHAQEAMAAAIKADQTSRYHRNIKARLHPNRPSYAMEHYFANLAMGLEGAAKSLRKRFAKRGIPLPFLEFLPQQVQQVR